MGAFVNASISRLQLNVFIASSEIAEICRGQVDDQ